MFVNIIVDAFEVYKLTFKRNFILAFLLSVVSEFIFIYFMNLIDHNIKHIHEIIKHNLLFVLGSISINFIFNVLIYMLITKNILDYLKNKRINSFGKIFEGISILTIIFFAIAIIINTIMLIFLSIFLSLIGSLIVIFITIIVYPAIVDGKGLIKSYLLSFKISLKYFFNILQISIVIVMLNLIKPSLYIIFANYGVSLVFGIEHVILIFVSSLILPFVISIMVNVYNTMIEKLSDLT